MPDAHIFLEQNHRHSSDPPVFNYCCRQLLYSFTTQCYVKLGVATVSRPVPSVRLSVTLRYRGHIEFFENTFIPRGVLCLQTPHITDLFQREHPEILAGIGVRYGKQWRLAYKSSNVSQTG